MRAFALLTAVCLTSCYGSMGPRTVDTDRINYCNAMSQSSKEQLLGNLLRLRYGEAPEFVEISSMIDQFSREGGANAALGFGTGFTAGDTQALGATARWMDRPTITYTPVQGQKFARSMLTPIQPEALFALVQAGWPPEVLLGITVTAINGVMNEIATPANRQHAAPRFWEALEVWAQLRNEGAMSIRLDEANGERSLIVFSRVTEEDVESHARLTRIQEILGLDQTGEYRMRYGLVPTSLKEIAVQSRSTIEIMSNLAWQMEVPPEHVRDGRTGATFRKHAGSRAPRIRLHYGCRPPKCPYVAVQNRGYWFWIDDGDMISKRVFTFLQILLTLSDTGEVARGPIVSIGG